MLGRVLNSKLCTDNLKIVISKSGLDRVKIEIYIDDANVWKSRLISGTYF